MKVIVTFYLLFLHAFAIIAISETDILPRVQAKFGYEIARAELTPYYHTMLAFHKRVDQNIPDKSIIFIGDSLIQGLAVSAVYQKSANFGIGQDTTAGVINRISDYRSISQAKAVVIAIGVNDLEWRSNVEIVRNYQKIIDLIPDNIPVLFSAVLPVDEVASSRVGTNDRIKKLNDSLSRICEKSQRLHFLDISKSLARSDGDLASDLHVGDGIHLNAAGNKIWIDKLKGYLWVMAGNI